MTEDAKKSIVDPKYAGRPAIDDFISQLIAAGSAKTRTVEVPVEGTTKTSKVQKPDGIDVDGLFAIAEKNGIDTTNHAKQRDGNGFPGRFRMTLGNMLRARAKRQHGVYDHKGKWSEAPADWLKANSAPEAATHKRDGSPVAAPKAAAPAKEPKAKADKVAA